MAIRFVIVLFGIVVLANQAYAIAYEIVAEPCSCENESPKFSSGLPPPVLAVLKALAQKQAHEPLQPALSALKPYKNTMASSPHPPSPPAPVLETTPPPSPAPSLDVVPTLPEPLVSGSLLSSLTPCQLGCLKQLTALQAAHQAFVPPNQALTASNQPQPILPASAPSTSPSPPTYPDGLPMLTPAQAQYLNELIALYSQPSATSSTPSPSPAFTRPKQSLTSSVQLTEPSLNLPAASPSKVSSLSPDVLQTVTSPLPGYSVSPPEVPVSLPATSAPVVTSAVPAHPPTSDSGFTFTPEYIEALLKTGLYKLTAVPCGSED